MRRLTLLEERHGEEELEVVLVPLHLPAVLFLAVPCVCVCVCVCVCACVRACVRVIRLHLHTCTHT